ncbi:hypothetical protein CEXT_128491 [Caerostris extrusa]|uniref:Uncharacterized protein n=1 Tax=Caerostris extrusa TaxID=172846 RepID=A0AAV4SB49_CAEEX|nr:hypothetical protein CEXT_128491 [Caerostris extrusa]
MVNGNANGANGNMVILMEICLCNRTLWGVKLNAHSTLVEEGQQKIFQKAPSQWLALIYGQYIDCQITSPRLKGDPFRMVGITSCISSSSSSQD